MSKNFGKATDLIDFSRSSGGTALRKISYGPELVTNGTFDTDTGWTDGSSGTGSTAIAGGVASVTGVDSSNRGILYQGFSTSAGKVYRCTFDVVESVSGNSYPRIGTAANTDGLYAFPNVVTGTYEAVFVASSATSYFTANVSSGTFEYDNISVKEVLFDQADGDLVLFNHPADVPRIEYAADGSVKGLLVEESRTNLLEDSEDMYVGSVGSVSVSNGLPWAGITPKLYTDVTSGATVTALSVPVTLAAAAHTTTLVIERAGATSDTTFGVILDGGGWVGLGRLDWDNETISTVAGTLDSSSVENLGTGPNGGKLLKVVYTVTTTAAAHGYYLYPFGSNGSSVTPGEAMYVYFQQLEAGAFPTSYIPTSGATATRSADVASIATSEFGYRETEGTLFVEYDRLYAGTNGMYIATISDGTTNNKLRFYGIGIGLDGIYGSRDSVQGTISASTGAMTLTSKKIAGAFAKDDAATIDSVGGSVAVDTSFDMPLDVSVISIGSSDGSLQLNGHVKSIKYYPRRLTDAQLQELTT